MHPMRLDAQLTFDGLRIKVQRCVVPLTVLPFNAIANGFGKRRAHCKLCRGRQGVPSHAVASNK